MLGQAERISLVSLLSHPELKSLPKQTKHLLNQRIAALQVKLDTLVFGNGAYSAQQAWLLRTLYLPAAEEVLTDLQVLKERYQASKLQLMLSALFFRNHTAQPLSELIAAHKNCINNLVQVLLPYSGEMGIEAIPVLLEWEHFERHWSPIAAHSDRGFVFRILQKCTETLRGFRYARWIPAGVAIDVFLRMLPGLLLSLIALWLLGTFIAKVLFCVCVVLPVCIFLLKTAKTWILKWISNYSGQEAIVHFSGFQHCLRRSKEVEALLKRQDLANLSTVQEALIPLITEARACLAQQEGLLQAFTTPLFCPKGRRLEHEALRQNYQALLRRSDLNLQEACRELLWKYVRTIEHACDRVLEQPFLVRQEHLQGLQALAAAFYRTWPHQDRGGLQERIARVLDPKYWILKELQDARFLSELQGSRPLPAFFPQKKLDHGRYQRLITELTPLIPEPTEREQVKKQLVFLGLLLEGTHRLDPNAYLLERLAQAFTPPGRPTEETKAILQKLLLDTFSGRGPLVPGILNREQYTVLMQQWKKHHILFEFGVHCLKALFKQPESEQPTILLNGSLWHLVIALKLDRIPLVNAAAYQGYLQDFTVQEAMQWMLLASVNPDLSAELKVSVGSMIEHYIHFTYQGVHARLFVLLEQFFQYQEVLSEETPIPEDIETLLRVHREKVLHYYQVLMAKRLEYLIRTCLKSGEKTLPLGTEDQRVLALLHLSENPTWDWDLFEKSDLYLREPWNPRIAELLVQLFQAQQLSYTLVEGYFSKLLEERTEAALQGQTVAPLIGMDIPALVIEALSPQGSFAQFFPPSVNTLRINQCLERLKPLLALQGGSNAQSLVQLQAVSQWKAPVQLLGAPDKAPVQMLGVPDKEMVSYRERCMQIKSLAQKIDAHAATPIGQANLRMTLAAAIRCQKFEVDHFLAFVLAEPTLHPIIAPWVAIATPSASETVVASGLLNMEKEADCCAAIAGVMLSEAPPTGTQRKILVQKWGKCLFDPTFEHTALDLLQETILSVPAEKIPYSKLILLGFHHHRLAEFISFVAVQFKHRAQIWAAFILYFHDHPEILGWIETLWVSCWKPGLKSRLRFVPRTGVLKPLFDRFEQMSLFPVATVHDQEDPVAFSLLLFSVDILLGYRYRHLAVPTCEVPLKNCSTCQHFHYLVDNAYLADFYNSGLFVLANSILEPFQEHLSFALNRNIHREKVGVVSDRGLVTSSTQANFEQWPLIDYDIFSKYKVRLGGQSFRSYDWMVFLYILREKTALSHLLVLSLIDQVDQFPLLDPGLPFTTRVSITGKTILGQQTRCPLPIGNSFSAFEVNDRERAFVLFKDKHFERYQTNSWIQRLYPLLEHLQYKGLMECQFPSTQLRISLKLPFLTDTEQMLSLAYSRCNLAEPCNLALNYDRRIYNYKNAEVHNHNGPSLFSALNFAFFKSGYLVEVHKKAMQARNLEVCFEGEVVSVKRRVGHSFLLP